MSKPKVVITNSFDEWRIITNTLSDEIGDIATISPDQTFTATDCVVTLNDLYTKKANRSGDTFTGAIQINSTLGVSGTSTLAAINASGDLKVATTKFTVASSTGNTSILGTLDVTGTAGLGVLNVSGATAFTLSPTAATPTTNDNSTKLATTAYYIGQAGTANPLMNSTVSIGTSYLFSRQDHVHASDTTRLSSTNPSATGELTITGGTITASTPLISATQTWNSAGVTFDGILVNVTNTASSAASLLLNFQLAGTTKFGVDINGGIKQRLTGTNFARDMVSGVSIDHIREYQDLIDANANGLDNTDMEWGYTWNAGWNGTSYIKDRNNAGDHALMVRCNSSSKHQWLWSDGTSPGLISFVNKVEFDLPNSLYTFTGSIYTGLLHTDNLITTTSTSVGSVTTLADYNVTVATTSTTTLATIDATIFRSATFEIQAFDATSGKYHKTLVSSIHNGTTADYVEYGSVAVVGICGTYSVIKSGSTLLLQVVSASANSTVYKIHSRLMAI